MRFPAFIRKINDFFAVISGTLIATMALFAFIEVVLRNFFDAPTIWTTNISQYMLLWALMLGSAYALQTKGHVSVDFIRVSFARRYGIKYARMVAIPCYCFCLVYIGVLFWKTYDLFIQAVGLGKLTLGMIQIPVAYLYGGILIGCILMAITVIFILLDLFTGSNEFASEEEI